MDYFVVNREVANADLPKTEKGVFEMSKLTPLDELSRISQAGGGSRRLRNRRNKSRRKQRSVRKTTRKYRIRH